MRKIHPEMRKFLDEKLKGDALAAHAIKTRNPRLLMVRAASVCVGIVEATGKNDGRIIELIQKTSGGGKGDAYCMFACQTWIAYAEDMFQMKSPVFGSGHCLTVWNNTPAEHRVRFIPLPGAIAIYRHGSTTNGHAETVIAADEGTFHAVGANTTAGTNTAGSIVRDGGGIHFTERSMKPSGSMRLLGFLKPF